MNPINPIADPTFIYLVLTFVVLTSILLLVVLRENKQLEHFRNTLRTGQKCRVRNLDGKLLYARIIEIRNYGVVLVRDIYSNGAHMVTRDQIFRP